MKLTFYLILLLSPFFYKNNNDDKLKIDKIEAIVTVNNEINREKRKKVALEFIVKLEKGENLMSLFSEKWEFIYQEEDRCTGLTYGKVTYGSHVKLNDKLRIKVNNKTEYAWACEKKESYYYELVFHLKERLKSWDKFELQNDEYSDGPNKKEGTFFILGGGASDYIKINVNENNLISVFKYSIEDPG